MSASEHGRAANQELFQEVKIGGVPIPNRFVYSATWDGFADDDGFCTPKNVGMLVGRAHGGVGLLITGMASVTLDGRAVAWQLSASDDGFMPGLSNMAQAVHDAHGKVFLQLAHAGCYARTVLTGAVPSGPSENVSDLFPRCREMTLTEIDRIIAAFSQAAARGKRAGFDGVQLHAAHGYLLSQFLSPFFNQRTDQYGGSLENRARLLLEVVQAVRKEVGKDYPVLVKINSEDFVENGLTADESLKVCAMLEKAGVDAIEMSGGTPPGKYRSFRTGVAKSLESESYYRKAAARYKQRIGIPLLLVGGIRSLEAAGSIMRDGIADFISLCRPLVCEQDLIGRWKAGYTKPSLCISCNGCIRPAREGNGLQCVL
ncbi:NADH:flavin oxidoreductase [Geomonas propionica]|uniref:NADH:flavin oxidoreductase n=1 Tax=Geomonas propionica TaxID=2798582 RepID=A0ABS0YLG0_9BACT|nr:NADH:flavin oxidoreductase [Geomonas propionica]MBJ6798809.1 NADH:flavin oxidoreductase [Geomonas propionica]